MTKLSVEIPRSLYNQLQMMARQLNQSLDDLLVELISQKFIPFSCAETIRLDCPSYGQFATDWALPPQFEQSASVKDK